MNTAELKLTIKDIRKALSKATHPSIISIYTRQLSEAEVQIRYSRLKDRVVAAGLDYPKWEEWARTLYDISDTFLVTSHAKEWKTLPVAWQFDDEISCLEKIEQLIGYKYYDHFVRQA